jgi:hypothetical protein
MQLLVYPTGSVTGSMEAAARTAIMTAFKKHFAMPSYRRWLAEFAAESVLASLPASGCATGSGRDPAQEPAQGEALLFTEADLPCTSSAALEAWGPLIQDHLGDNADSQDVAGFCADCLSALANVAAQHNGGVGDDSSDGSGTESGVCELCEREMPLTRHHLIPRCVRGRAQVLRGELS